MAEVNSTPGNQSVNMNDLATALGEAVAKGIAANTRPKKTFGQYTAEGGHSPFHPKPGQGLKLTRECYQNAFRIQEHMHTDKEIALLNRITHSGRYIDRKVEVIVDKSNAEEVVDIRFSNQTVDQRFELKGLCRNFEDMLRQIVEAQEEEDEEAATRPGGAQRHFGDSKATREARAKASA